MGFLELSYGKEENIREYINFDGQISTGMKVKQLFLFALVASIEAVFPFLWGWEKFCLQLCYLSNWLIFATIILISIIIVASNDPNINNRPGMLAAVHIWFEFAFIFNLCVVAIYWTIVHPTEILKYEGDAQIFYMYYSHIAPAFVTLASYLLLDVRFKASHAYPFVLLSIVYGAINFAITKYTGKPVYDFLDWKDYKSFVLYICITACFYGSYMGLVRLSFELKPPPSKQTKGK